MNPEEVDTDEEGVDTFEERERREDCGNACTHEAGYDTGLCGQDRSTQVDPDILQAQDERTPRALVFLERSCLCRAMRGNLVCSGSPARLALFG